MAFNNEILREAIAKWFVNQEEAEAKYGPIFAWNTSGVTDMSFLFAGKANFNGFIGLWDTSKVINMSHMFSGATAFNQCIKNWKTGKVANMCKMFQNASSFNHDVSGWNFSRVTNVSFMFHGATSYSYNFNNVRFKKKVNIDNMFSHGASYVMVIRAPEPEDVPLPPSPRLSPRVDILNKKAFHKGALIEIEEFETRVIFNVVLLKLRGPILENDETAIRCTISKDACVPYRQWYTWFYSKRSAIKTREDEAIRVASILFPSDENVAAVTGTPTTVEDFDFDPVNKDA